MGRPKLSCLLEMAPAAGVVGPLAREHRLRGEIWLGRSQGFARDRLYRRLALEWMREHPGEAVALTLLGALFFGNARFRWPAHDLLPPFAAVAAVAAVSLAERARSRAGAAGGGSTEAAG